MKRGILITVIKNDQNKLSIFHFNITNLNQKTEGGLSLEISDGKTGVKTVYSIPVKYTHMM